MTDASLLQDFIAETVEHLEALENNLLELEAAPDNRSLLNEIFRSVHTIKGASEYLGMERIAQLSHTMESLLEMLRHGDRAPDQDLIDVVIDARDRMASLVGDIQREQVEKTPIDDLLLRMTAMKKGPVSMGGSPENLPQATPEAASEAIFPELSFMDDVAEPPTCGLPSKADSTPGPRIGVDFVPPAPRPDACGVTPVEPCEEEYDTELFEIFLQHLRENLARILHHIDGAESSPGAAEALRACLPAVEAMLSSANYMDYGAVTQVHTAWRSQIQKAVSALETGLPVSFETPDGSVSDVFLGMKAYIGSLIDRFPRLADLLAERTGSPDHAALPETSTMPVSPPSPGRPADRTETPAPTPPPAEEAPAAPPSDFQGLFDELESAFDSPGPDAEDPFELETLLESDQGQTEARLEALSPGPPKTPASLIRLASAHRGEGRRTAAAETPVDPHLPRAEDAIAPSETRRTSPPAMPAAPEALPDAVPASTQSDKPTTPEEPRRSDPLIDKAVKQSLRVDARKIDALMNQVGELVVSRAWFSQLHQEIRQLQDYLKEKVGLDQREMKPVKALSFRISEAIVALGRASNELQEGVMKVRMLPIAQLFNRYPRLVRDLIHDLDKKVHLEILGEETELDKMVIEEISDPLIHLIRNAVDHGCETVPERLAAGKPEECRLRLQSYHESNHVVIEISDDGRGMDPEKIRRAAIEKGIATPEELEPMSRRELMELVMRPGFSTAREVTRVSGRGVGMDVVKQNVERLSGTIEIDSRVGEGTRFRIKIPLTLAIIQALLVRVGEEIFTIPLTAVEETLRISREEVTTIEGVECIYLRNSTLSLLRLSDLFGIRTASRDDRRAFVVVVNTGMRRVGLVVDALIGQEETVIKPLVDYLREGSGFSGATILGDGRISLILDVYELIKLSIGSHARAKRLGGLPESGEIGENRRRQAAAALHGRLR